MANCTVSEANVGEPITLTVIPTQGLEPFTVTIKKDSTTLYTVSGVLLNQEIGIQYTTVPSDAGTRRFSAIVSYVCPLDSTTKTITDYCDVNIIGIPEVTTVSLSGCNTALSPDLNPTCTLTASCLDQYGASIACGTITWVSSNPSVATVSNGTVTAVAQGTATITATTLNGKTATKQITVNPVTPVYGSISFVTDPAGAQIWVDGLNTDKVTPATVSSLLEGAHLYILKLDGYKDKAGQINVIGNSTVTVSETLEKLFTDESITLNESLTNYNCYGFITPKDAFTGAAGDKKIVAIYATGDCLTVPPSDWFTWYLWDTVQLTWTQFIQTPAIATNPGFARTEVMLPSNSMFKVMYGFSDIEKIFTIGAGQVVQFGLGMIAVAAGAGLLLLSMLSKKEK